MTAGNPKVLKWLDALQQVYAANQERLISGETRLTPGARGNAKSQNQQLAVSKGDVIIGESLRKIWKGV